MKISASIVIYNENKETLKKVIDSFLALELEKELIIVDNSPDDELSIFCQSFESISYIFSGENLGFGGGHNLAFKNLKEKSDIHMIINPDVYFDFDEINSFLNWFYNQKDVSLATTKVCYPDGKNQNIIRNIPTSFFDLVKRKLKLNSGELDIKENIIKEVPFAHGCFFVFKTEVFQNLSGFDERFFMYMEDIDIFIRAKKYGKTVINTNYKIYHEFRKGSSKSFKLLKYHIISAYKFFRKYKAYNLNDYN